MYCIDVATENADKVFPFSNISSLALKSMCETSREECIYNCAVIDSCFNCNMDFKFSFSRHLLKITSNLFFYYLF